MDSLKLFRAACATLAVTLVGVFIFTPVRQTALSTPHNIDFDFGEIYNHNIDTRHSDTDPLFQAVYARNDVGIEAGAEQVLSYASKQPNPLPVYGIAARQFQSPSAKNHDDPAAIVTARAVLQFATQAEPLDPKNTFWPFSRAYAYTILEDHQKVKSAFLDAANCDHYNEFAWEEVNLRSNKPDLTEIEHIRVAGSVMFPHLSGWRQAAKSALFNSPDNIELRAAIAKSADIVLSSETFFITGLVALNVQRSSVWKVEEAQKSNDVSAADLKRQTLTFDELAPLTKELSPHQTQALKKAVALSNFQANSNDYFDESTDTYQLIGTNYPERQVLSGAFALLALASLAVSSRFLKSPTKPWIPLIIPCLSVNVVAAFDPDVFPLTLMASLVLSLFSLASQKLNQYVVPTGIVAITALTLPLEFTPMIPIALVYLTFWWATNRAKKQSVRFIVSALAVTATIFAPAWHISTVESASPEGMFVTVVLSGLFTGWIYFQLPDHQRLKLGALACIVATGATLLATANIVELNTASARGIQKFKQEGTTIPTQVNAYLANHPELTTN